MKRKICIIILTVFMLLFNNAVFADEFEEDDDIIDAEEVQKEILQTVAEPSKELNLNSKAVVVIDRESKKILYGKNENDRRAMASTTKIMTCIIALESSKLDETIVVSKQAAAVGGSRLGLSAGDKITMIDLLYGLMLCSGNDAAAQIAQTIGGSYEGFSILMNSKAKEIGLKETHFVTPHGLDNDEHYTTAYELALLTDYALNNQKFKQIVGTKTKSILINGYQKNINNTNELLGVLNGVNGVKTGFTNNAGRCLVVSCVRNDMNLISVVLGADTKRFRTKDSIKVLEYAFANYSQIDLKERINKTFKEWKSQNSVEIIKGKEQFIAPQIEQILFDKYPVKKGKEEDIKIKIECQKALEAPVFKDTQIGTAEIYIGNEKILELKLTLPHTIYKKEPEDYWYSIWKTFKTIQWRVSPNGTHLLQQ